MAARSVRGHGPRNADDAERPEPDRNQPTLQSRAREALTRIAEPSAQKAILGFANVLVAGLDFFGELENGKAPTEAANVAVRKYKRRARRLRKVDREVDQDPGDR